MNDDGSIRRGVIKAMSAKGALVATPKRGICQNCSEKELCFGVGKDAPDMIDALNPIDAKVGDMVQFRIPEGTMLKVAMLVYVMPLLGLGAGAALVSALAGSLGWQGEGPSILGALLGFGLSIAVCIVIDRRRKDDPRYVPVIEKRLGKAIPCAEDGDGEISDPT